MKSKFKSNRDIVFLFLFTILVIVLPLLGVQVWLLRVRKESFQQYNFASDQGGRIKAGFLKASELSIVQNGHGTNGVVISDFSELEQAQLLVALTRYNDARTLQAALDQGVSVNAREEYDVTALHAAVAFRRADIVKVLMRNNADVAAKAAGLTPLDYLDYPAYGDARAGTDEQIRQLLLAGPQHV